VGSSDTAGHLVSFNHLIMKKLDGDNQYDGNTINQYVKD